MASAYQVDRSILIFGGRDSMVVVIPRQLKNVRTIQQILGLYPYQ
jgi:hypothetical protein